MDVKNTYRSPAKQFSMTVKGKYSALHLRRAKGYWRPMKHWSSSADGSIFWEGTIPIWDFNGTTWTASRNAMWSIRTRTSFTKEILILYNLTCGGILPSKLLRRMTRNMCCYCRSLPSTSWAPRQIRSNHRLPWFPFRWRTSNWSFWKSWSCRSSRTCKDQGAQRRYRCQNCWALGISDVRYGWGRVWGRVVCRGSWDVESNTRAEETVRHQISSSTSSRSALLVRGRLYLNHWAATLSLLMGVQGKTRISALLIEI